MENRCLVYQVYAIGDTRQEKALIHLPKISMTKLYSSQGKEHGAFDLTVWETGDILIFMSRTNKQGKRASSCLVNVNQSNLYYACIRNSVTVW